VLVYGLSDYYIHRHRNDYKPTLILGYANLTEIEIVKGTGIIKSVLETVN
jgi:GntR family transcriptional regulator/MocR family aminotransferase